MPEENLKERDAWWNILTVQVKQRPQWQLQDIYKLAYQAALGSEHAAPDEVTARRWLEQELAGLGVGPTEDTLEPISPDSQLVRVNLRPYLARGRDPHALLAAFLRTALEWRGNGQTLVRYLEWTLQWIAAMNSATQVDAADIFFTQMKDLEYPPAHHSMIYREMYRPAYRVVLKKFIVGD